MNRKLIALLTAAAAALVAAPLASMQWSAGARADDFELAMVIKETTNPYYNATLKGAQIAASEAGGTAKNYGPTQSSAQAQVELINNLADRHVAAIAVAPSDPDAVVPAMKRAQKLGVREYFHKPGSLPGYQELAGRGRVIGRQLIARKR